MMRNGKKNLWRQLDESMGFFHDERTERVQQLGGRRSYWLTAVLFPIVAIWHQTVHKVGGLWVILTAVLFSLIYLWWQHRQLVPLDERANQILNRSYRYAYLFLLLALLGYFTILFWRSGWATPGMFIWPPAILVTLLPLFATHIQQRSYPTRTWQRIALIALIGVLAAFWLGMLLGRATQ